MALKPIEFTVEEAQLVASQMAGLKAALVRAQEGNYYADNPTALAEIEQDLQIIEKVNNKLIESAG